MSHCTSLSWTRDTGDKYQSDNKLRDLRVHCPAAPDTVDVSGLAVVPSVSPFLR